MASHESSKNLNVLLHNFGREIKLYLDNSDWSKLPIFSSFYTFHLAAELIKCYIWIFWPTLMGPVLSRNMKQDSHNSEYQF